MLAALVFENTLREACFSITSFLPSLTNGSCLLACSLDLASRVATAKSSSGATCLLAGNHLLMNLPSQISLEPNDGITHLEILLSQLCQGLKVDAFVLGNHFQCRLKQSPGRS